MSKKKKEEFQIVVGRDNEVIDEMIRDAQKRCRARLTNASEVERICDTLRKHFKISNTALDGCVFDIDTEEGYVFPNCYGFTAYSTHVKAVFNKKLGFCVTEIYRGTCDQFGRYVEVQLTDKAKEAILKSYTKIKGYDVRE